MPYLNCKQVGRTKLGVKKPKSLLTITEDQWKSVLQAVEDSAPTNPKWERDYALIYLGAAIGMRRGEITLYERRHFKDLEQYDTIHVPTLKQSEKVPFECPGCKRKVRLKMSSCGQSHECTRCGKKSQIPALNSTQTTNAGVIEKDVDIVEPRTAVFILDYLKNCMRADQRWLFESVNGYHISPGHANRIFNTYAQVAGLDKNISFHSLRHNRGVKVYSLFKDMILCRDALRHKNVATTQIYASLDQEQKQHYRDELNKKAFDPLKNRKARSKQKAN